MTDRFAHLLDSEAKGLDAGGSPAFLAPGVYEHFKGGLYRLLLVARDEATKEPVVVYVSVSGGGGECWVRPVHSWLDEVDAPGGRRPRFRPV
jgi:hypothetical protein